MINIGNKFIHVENVRSKNTKPAYAVVNTKADHELASIEWYSSWRGYVLIPRGNTVWDAGCLESVITFIRHLKTK